LYGTKIAIGNLNQALITGGDDGKTFQAAMIEYSKDQPTAKVSRLVLSVVTTFALTHVSVIIYFVSLVHVFT